MVTSNGARRTSVGSRKGAYVRPMMGWEPLVVPLPDSLPDSTRSHLAAVGVSTVAELVEWFPRRYVEPGSTSDMGSVDVGTTVTFVGEILRGNKITTRTRKRLYTVVITDGTQTINATFFNAFAPARDLVVGTRAIFVGTVSEYRGALQLAHPAYKVIDFAQEWTLDTQPADEQPKRSSSRNIIDRDTAALVTKLPLLPIYPLKSESSRSASATDGDTGSSKTGKQSTKRPAKRSKPGSKRPVRVDSWTALDAITTVLTHSDPIPDPLPRVPTVQGKLLPSLDHAIRAMHMPSSWADQAMARKRLAFNEALGLQLILASRRHAAADRRAPQCAPREDGYRAELLAGLPFDLTDQQRAVTEEIGDDIAATRPMCRLLQGDVGSGKTIVALIAMLQAVDAGCQAALLAPTEVLAAQHAHSLMTMMANAGVAATIRLVTGSMSTSSRQETLLSLMTGETDIVVGTHALLSDNVEFFNLGLVVVDEQHRFGVEQRDRLRGRGRDTEDGPLTPHQLVMTATPIPRTVAMTTFGDLNVSTITELPGGRKPIQSSVVPEWKKGWLDRAYQRIREEVESGRQAYIVCPRIQGDGGVNDMYEKLTVGPLHGLRVGMLHGQLPNPDKERIMGKFSRGDCDVLISTTVIEVGVDVPNATLMLIREAENFGISQLHQLRGRIGRGSHASWCLFHTAQPEDSDSYRRLQGVAATTDGFALAELDLATRSEGDLVGADQSGRSTHIRLLDVVHDEPLIEAAKTEAEHIVQTDPGLARRLSEGYSSTEREFLGKG
ncbi:ATP-dependent DNA helicase RecG [Corynebacterium kroppenstedtii]|uniref:ATP-dependent DNA helicase RecG n=1 Tax=Corynebacterium kroppenstedtii TaxID=161879 RepID=UPI0009D670E6|nr:ATP-dependent DNA helicase RecG [Corynebacterium kroppenstedtii]QRP10658.1 ATP-dependent DNA helicase RecG [Corynebacterium kroppenstedtii]